MQSPRTHAGCLTALILQILLQAGSVHAGDWPMAGGDLSRSGVTGEQLTLPLHPQWTHVPAHPPKPAWPEPGRELNRVAFDYAYAATVCGGLVFFGSSADHKVYALDLASGRVRWSAFTGGPVRFAPAVSDDRVFVASDDGCVYCLAAPDGRELWRFRAAAGNRKVIGNEQMISRWPLRSGVVVDGQTVYVAAGMWPSEGVYLYALQAESGNVVWQTVDQGTQYKKQPHPPSEAFLGVAPQGYMIGDSQRLAIPTGRNMPAVYDRQTGRQLHYRSAPRDWGTRWGGSWCQLADNYLVTWNTHFQPDVNVMPGEFKPDPKDGMWFFEADTGKELQELRGKLCAVLKDDVLYASGTGKLSAYAFRPWITSAKPVPTPTPLWEAPLERTYCLIAAGHTLFAGGADTITAFSMKDGSVVWKGTVEGQVRFLAATDGRLLASTTTGQIACFGREPTQAPATTRPERPAPPPIPPAATALAQRLLAQSGKTSGYCLVLGASDADLLRALAAESDLQIHCAESNAKAVTGLRQVLDAAGLYGNRVVVHETPDHALPFPNYFADLIVAVDGQGSDLTRWPATDVHRILHPNGGQACFVARKRLLRDSTTPVRRWLLKGNVEESQIAVSDETVQLTRGPLPGTDDWTHQYAGPGRTGASEDTLARVPLEVLWFGQPGPGMMVARHWRGPAPLCASGRMFVIGECELVCADAYNGREIWRRDLGLKDGKPVKLARWPVDIAGSSVVVDNTSVYIATEKACLRLDAGTGKTVATYRMPEYPVPLTPERAAALQWQHLAVVGDTVLGSMGDNKVGRGVFVLDRDTEEPRWIHVAAGSIGINALAMDDAGVYLLDGATPEELAAAKRRGQKAPAALTLYALDLRTGNPMWHLAKNLDGAIDVRVARDVVLVTGRRMMTGIAALTGEVLYNRTIGVPKVPVIVGDTTYIQPYAYDLKTGENRMQTHPFSGDRVPWTFTRSYGCGQISGSSNLLMFRSGALGFYDLAGDSGTHNFAGIRAGCSTNAIAAGGLLLSAPADASCTCSYSFRTTLALAPAARNPGWGLMYTGLPTTAVKTVALNLGAPGDRRDSDGTLWMAAPHPSAYNARPSYSAPFQYQFSEGGGPQATASGPLVRAGETRPWLYSTALQGLRKATFDLTIFPNGYLSWPAAVPPALDGAPTDTCWDGYKAVPIQPTGTNVTLRHDSKTLYLCYTAPANKSSDGTSKPWRKNVTDSDGDIWKDHSFEAFFSSVNRSWREPSKRCLHLGVSASGARYDALWEYVDVTLPVLDVPPVSITVDGDIVDWGEEGLRVQSLPGPKGKLRPASDLDMSCRLGWTMDGLAVLVDVTDNVVHEDPNADQLWWGDSIEMFVTPKAGTGNYVQTAISPGADGTHADARYRFYDQRRDKTQMLSARFAGSRTDTGWRVEMLWPWKNLGITPADGTEFGLQLFVNDDDGKGRNNWFRTRWHPLGHPQQTPDAFQTLRLAATPSAPLQFRRTDRPGADGLFDVALPTPFTVTEPGEMGTRPEDRSYSAVWQSAVSADATAFVAEMAIPWETLQQAGIPKGAFMIDLTGRGPLKTPPVNGRGFQKVVLASDDAGRPRTVNVRLHFGDTDTAGPGTRTADIKLQGKTVFAGFDVNRERGGAMYHVVKEVSGLQVNRTLVLELEPRPGCEVPSLSGIEIHVAEEGSAQ